MYLYLAPLVGTGTRRDPYRSVGMMPGASITDLRPDCTVPDGFCILATPAPVADPRALLLGEQPHEPLSGAARAILSSRLGITPGAQVTLAEAIFALMVSPPSGRQTWSRLEPTHAFGQRVRRGANPRRHELWLGGQLVLAVPVIEGGASFSDDFNRADSSSLGANWTLLKGAALSHGIVNNEVLATPSFDGDRVWQWNTACDTADHFAELRVVANYEFSADMGPMTRVASSSGANGYYVTGYVNDPQFGKFTANTQTLIASISPYPFEFTWLRLSSSGSTHKVFIGPRGAQTEVYSGTDTTFASNLGVGIFLYAEAGALDDWYGGDGTGEIGPITPDGGPFPQKKMVRHSVGGNFDITYDNAVVTGNTAVIILATGPTTIAASHITTIAGSTGTWVLDKVQNNGTDNNIAVLRAPITGSGTLTVRINVGSATHYQACVIETDPLAASPLTGHLSATAVSREVSTGTGNNTAAADGVSLTAMAHDGSGSPRVSVWQPPWTKLGENESTAGFPMVVGWKHSAAGDPLVGRFTNIGNVRYYALSVNYELAPQSTYTLQAAGGTYALTGTAATLTRTILPGTIIQSKAARNAALTFDTDVTAGSTILLFVLTGPDEPVVADLSDTQSNTYITPPDAGQSDGPDTAHAAAFRTTAGASGSLAITYAGDNDLWELVGIEIAGDVEPSGTPAGDTDTGTSAASGAMTATDAGQVFGVLTHAGSGTITEDGAWDLISENEATAGSVGSVQFAQGNATRYDYADNAGYDSTSTMSWAGWFNFTNFSGFRMVFFKPGAYYVATTGTDLLFAWYNGAGSVVGFSTALPSTGVWTHIAWAVQTNTPHKVWINGTDLGLSPTTHGGGTRDLTSALSVGGNPSGGGSNVRIAQFAIKNASVWTTQEIADLQLKPANEAATLSAYMSYDTPGGVVAKDDQINAITPTSDTSGGGSITAQTGPALGIAGFPHSVIHQASTASGSYNAEWTLGSSARWTAFVINYAVALTGYTLEAEGGSYALSGASAALEVGRVVGAAPGSYASSGTAAALELGYRMSADAGTYALAGTAAALRATRQLQAVPGTYALGGTTASLEIGARLDAAGGSYALAGSSANLLWSGAPSTYTLEAEAGSYAQSGTAASLRASRALPAAGGTYTLAGGAAALRVARALAAQGGTLAVEGTAAALRATRLLGAAAGSYAASGAAAALVPAYRLQADAGGYTVAGTSAALSYSGSTYVLVAEEGGFALSGQAADLRWTHVLPAAGGAYVATGAAAALIAARQLDADGGSYALVGTAARTLAGREVAAAPGSYALSGQDAALSRTRVLEAVPGIFQLVGTPATLIAGEGLLLGGVTFAEVRMSGPRVTGVRMSVARTE
jgi:hypothetical protein